MENAATITSARRRFLRLRSFPVGFSPGVTEFTQALRTLSARSPGGSFAPGERRSRPTVSGDPWMKKLMWAAAAVAALVTAFPAAAQFAKPEDAIKYRKAAFNVLSTHFGRVGAMVNGKAPFDAKAAADNADIALSMAKLPYTAFVDGTDKGETRAKPEIWAESDRFKAAALKMQEEMGKLNAATKTGNFDTIKAAFGPVGQA